MEKRGKKQLLDSIAKMEADLAEDIKANKKNILNQYRNYPYWLEEEDMGDPPIVGWWDRESPEPDHLGDARDLGNISEGSSPDRENNGE